MLFLLVIILSSRIKIFPTLISELPFNVLRLKANGRAFSHFLSRVTANFTLTRKVSLYSFSLSLARKINPVQDVLINFTFFFPNFFLHWEVLYFCYKVNRPIQFLLQGLYTGQPAVWLAMKQLHACCINV